MASARDPRLEAAVQRGDANRVRAALGVGADKIHAVNQYGSPIIHMASSLGKEAAIEVLIQRGANLDDANGVGWTAMMLAARDGHPGALRLLLEANADPTLRDREGRSALDWALASAHSDNSECTTLLQNAVVPAGLCMTPFSGMSMKYDTRQMDQVLSQLRHGNGWSWSANITTGRAVEDQLDALVEGGNEAPTAERAGLARRGVRLYNLTGHQMSCCVLDPETGDELLNIGEADSFNPSRNPKSAAVMTSPGTVVRVQCGERSADYTVDLGSSQMILVHTRAAAAAMVPIPMPVLLQE